MVEPIRVIPRRRSNDRKLGPERLQWRKIKWQ